MSLPPADDLFRRTAARDKAAAAGKAAPVRAVPDAVPDAAPEPAAAQEAPGRRPSGRIRHDEKMTVYVTADELLDLEHTRLSLRRSHGLAVDRGRLVREAVALVLADFDQHGADSALVRRLTGE